MKPRAVGRPTGRAERPAVCSAAWAGVCAGLAALLLATGCAAFGRLPARTLAELLPAEKETWNRPLRLTRGPGAESNADYNARSGRLTYVSDQEGSADIFLQDDPLSGLEPARELAPHSARDRWPRFDPDGKRLVFVSTRQDSTGDLWLLPLGGLFSRPQPSRLTTSLSADDQPCWHPDGSRVFYASSPSPGGPFDLWELRPGRQPVRITEGGGQMPDCSPDGRHLVFVSSREGGHPDLWLLRLGDHALARLTSGPALDLYPCWSSDGARILFARTPLDTNGDGRLDRRDASAIFSVSFSEDVFSGREPPFARQLTSLAAPATFPRPVPGGFLFTRALGGGSSDVLALAESGEVPDCGSVSGYLRFALRVEQEEAADVHRRLLAWQNVAWAALSAEGAGGEALDLPHREDAALAWLRMAGALLDMGRPQAAKQVLQELMARFPTANRHVGLARVELLALERAELASPARLVAGTSAAWQAHLEEADRLKERWRLLSAEARGAGDLEEAAALEETCALAQLEIGLSHLARRDYAAALEALRLVPAGYPAHKEACARALLALADVYRVLDDPRALQDAYLKVLTDCPDVPRHAAVAAGRLVDVLVSPEAPLSEKVAGLREVVELHSDVPVLPALAQNYLGDLYYAQKDYLRAVAEYRRTIERFPGERSQVAAAYLAIGRIRTEQQDYEEAVDIFRRMQEEFGRSGGWLYERARRGYVSSVLLKAGRALELGDVQLALGAYARLMDFEPDLAAAHRGLVQCYARLGRTDDAILLYRPRVESAEGAHDHVADYALALAYSYHGPADWVGDKAASKLRARIDREALRLVERAILEAPDVPYYHQLRGFLLSRLALATGQDEWKAESLDAYLSALGLSRPEDDPTNYAALLFNVGEGYVLAGRPEAGYDYFRRALEAGFPVTGTQGETALLEMSRSAMAAGDYAFAIQLLEKLVGMLGGATQGDSQAVSGLRRQAETLDLLALAYHLAGDYAGAARQCRRYVQGVERLIAVDPRGERAYRRNLLRAHRNLAVNLYLSVQQGQAEATELGEALGLLEGAAQQLGSLGVVEWAEGESPGLINVDVDVALGRKGEPAAFDAGAERRLLYTYLARLKAASGEYGEAVQLLREKLELYPAPETAATQRDVLCEQGVVWTQVGEYELARGNAAGAAEAYRRAVSFERLAESLEGEAASAVSLGRAVLRWAHEGAEAASAVREAVNVHREVLARVRRGAGQEGGAYLVPLEAALDANLMALLEAVGAEEGRQ